MQTEDTIYAVVISINSTQHHKKGEVVKINRDLHESFALTGSVICFGLVIKLKNTTKI